MTTRLAPPNAALQHGRAPRPLPLFLELVRAVAADDPRLAQRALAGLARYRAEERTALPPPAPVVAAAGAATLRHLGGRGSPVVLVPSLINAPRVLDLPGQSLAAALAAQHRVLLVDWGPAHERALLDLGGHIEALLVPLIAALAEPVALVGYCLGGTMVLAAANLVAVQRVATLAAPWRFDAYSECARSALGRLLTQAMPASRQLGALPTEVLQTAFWSLDPHGLVAKFARLADEPAGSATARRFVTLEDWANDGEPVPLPAARELIEDLFIANRPGRGAWRVAGRLIAPDPAPAVHFAARNDRIVPAASVAPGAVRAVAAGHVGMVVGRLAPAQLHAPLLAFLAQRFPDPPPPCPPPATRLSGRPGTHSSAG